MAFLAAIPIATVLAGASVAASAAGAGVAAMGAMGSAHAQQQAANYQAGVAANNAKIAQQNAAYVQQQGETQAEQQEMRTRAEVGAQRAGLAANGLDINSGTPLAVQSSTEALGTYNADVIRSNAARQAFGYQQQGSNFSGQSGLDLATGQNAAAAGGLNAVGSILGGASSVANKWLAYQQQGNFGGLF